MSLKLIILLGRLTTQFLVMYFNDQCVNSHWSMKKNCETISLDSTLLSPLSFALYFLTSIFAIIFVNQMMCNLFHRKICLNTRNSRKSPFQSLIVFLGIFCKIIFNHDQYVQRLLNPHLPSSWQSFPISHQPSSYTYVDCKMPVDSWNHSNDLDHPSRL